MFLQRAILHACTACVVSVAALVLAGTATAAQEAGAPGVPVPPTAQQVELSPAQLFAFADAARHAGDFDTAERAYRALTTNPDPELRTEARFRLALMLADHQHKYREAAVLLREILDEKPEAARVRVELARVLATMGDLGSAARELRAAQAAGLPPEVDRLVRFYAGALRAQRPFGGSLAVALAPDSNINQATSSDTLGTIIGDFNLSEDAKAQSGLGLDLKGQAFARLPIDGRATLLLQASGAGRFYRKSRFDDYILAAQAGPQYDLGADRFNISGVVSWRWFGREPYSFGYGVNADWQHPIGKRGRLSVDAAIIRTDDRLADLRDATRFSLATGVDRAFSARFGGGFRLSASRSDARDAGYSTADGGLDVYLFREFGSTTAVLKAGYSHLEADRRLFLYPRRRIDDRFTLELSGTFRSFRIGSFAPLARVRFERNKSSVEIYDFQRIAAELGITAAF